MNMKILYILLMMLGLTCTILSIYGSAHSQASITLLISNLGDLRAEKPAEAAELEKLASRASSYTRESHKRLRIVGLITTGLAFLGTIIGRPRKTTATDHKIDRKAGNDGRDVESWGQDPGQAK